MILLANILLRCFAGVYHSNRVKVKSDKPKGRMISKELCRHLKQRFLFESVFS